MIGKFQTVKGEAGDVRVIGYASAGAGHEQPTFTNMAGSTVPELVREVSTLRSLRHRLTRAGAHMILAHDKGQRALTQDEWREALDIALGEHGAEGAPYAAWLHDNDQHLHVFLLRIRPDGSVVSDSNSWRKNERAARRIESHLGLAPPKPRSPEDRHPRAQGAKAERGRRRFERLSAEHTTPDQPTTKGVLKLIDPHIIFSTIDESKDLDDLIRRLAAERGIEVSLVKAPGAAEPTGWSLRQAGPAGCWIKGSDVDRGLSLKKVRERIEERRGQRPRNPYARPKSPYAQQIPRSWAGLIGLMVGLSAVAAIHLVAGFVNLIARALARKADVPEETLGCVEVAEDGTPTFILPVDLPDDAPAEQQARVDAAQAVMVKVLDQTAAAIEADDTSKLPTLSDPEVEAEREQVIRELDQIEPDDEGDGEPYERERP